jgi:hypothetical protein
MLFKNRAVLIFPPQKTTATMEVVITSASLIFYLGLRHHEVLLKHRHTGKKWLQFGYP